MQKKTVKRTVYVMNEYHVKVKKCCASCLFKRIDYKGNRRCPQWEMNNVCYAGRRWGTVRKLTDVVID